MYLKINNKKVTVNLLTTIPEKIKSLRFKLNNIEEGICFSKKRNINTYFFCQKVDIIFTDINNNILKISRNTNSEKFVFGKRKGFFIYILQANLAKDLKNGEKLKITYDSEEKEYLSKYKN